MILYGVVILIAWVVVILLNYFISANIFGFGIWYIIFAVVLSTIVVMAIDGITAGVVRLMPSKWFDPFAKKSKVCKWEKSFYERLGIKKWKDLVPDLGQLTRFKKNKIAEPKNNEYIKRYLLEAMYGRVGHFVSFFTGFLVIFIYPLEYALCFGVPVAVVNLLLNSLSWMTLRYNTPKLITLYRWNERNQIKENDKTAE